jgi:rubrerythrin
MLRPMKPETIARRAAERAARRERDADTLTARLQDAATRHGPESVFHELAALRPYRVLCEECGKTHRTTAHHLCPFCGSADLSAV